jgi:3-oxoacyl-[acyl-carrier protein] reductase
MSPSDKQIALVTGASRGIGRAIAVSLAESGRHVLINYRARQQDAEGTLEQVQKIGGSGELLPFDVTDASAVDTAIAAAIQKHGRLDVLVNNAGVHKDMLLVWMKPEDWQSVLQVNLTGFYLVTRPVVKQMMLQRSGRIITISSTSGQSGVAGQVNYAAAKAGLIGATKALAKEVGKRKITVNAVAPGFIETEMLQDMDLKQLIDAVPLGRLGRPEEVAALVVFLCHPLAAYISGQVIGVNGGVY